MLYLVATPIGNLSDITLRALEVLKKVSYILCEDTRQSRKLLQKYEITTRLESYHQFNESKKSKQVLDDLETGIEIALISDAGTPCISDPGALLVKKCHEKKLRLTAIPGPSSVITSLSLTGFAATSFQFVGFLPKKEGSLRHLLIELLSYPGTSVCFETPHRLLKTLHAIHQLAANKTICVVKELTKKFEEVAIAPIENFITRFSKNPPKGEYCLLFEGFETSFYKEKAQKLFILLQRDHGLSIKDASKIVTDIYSIPKKELYSYKKQS